jgi:PTS system mannose-specific IIA component
MSEKKDRNWAIGIIVTHGGLAVELLHTAELIVGKLEDCYAISGSDLSDEVLENKVKDIMKRGGGRNVILFVDHFGGSCCTKCIHATKDIDGVKVISGVNLPLLLDFATKRGSMEFEEMVDHLIRRGRESVKVVDYR